MEDEFLTVKISKKDADLALTDKYEEGLGKDYLKTPYRKPNKEDAKDTASSNKFRNGAGSVLGTTIDELSELGLGVVLYFKLLHLLACTFTCMSLLYIPVFMIVTTGGAINSHYVDVLHLIDTTIANIPTANASQAQDLFELGSTHVQYRHTLAMLCACDFAALFVFFLAFLWAMHIIQQSEDTSARDITARSYCVYVTHLPPDATEDEIRGHFSNLYDLDNSVPTRRRSSLGDYLRGVATGALTQDLRPTPNRDAALAAQSREPPGSDAEEPRTPMSVHFPFSSYSPTRPRSQNSPSKIERYPSGESDFASQTEHTMSPFASTLNASPPSRAAVSPPARTRAATIDSPEIAARGAITPKEDNESERCSYTTNPMYEEEYPTFPGASRFNTSITQMASQGQLRSLPRHRALPGDSVLGAGQSPMTFLELIRPKPVLDTTFCGSQRYLHSWVAEVSIAKPIGDRLRFYLSTQQLQIKLMQTRARAKFFAQKLKKMHGAPPGASQNRDTSPRGPSTMSENDLSRQAPVPPAENSDVESKGDVVTPEQPLEREALSAGSIRGVLLSAPNTFTFFQQKLRNAQDEADQLERKIRDVAARWRQRQRCTMCLREIPALVVEKTKLDSCIGAFVVFNNRKSQQLCLEEGKAALSVQEAPEPSDVKWENLDVSSSERFTRNAIVDGITIGILAIAMYTMYSIFGDKANSSTKILSSSSSNDDTVFYINEYSNIPTNSATCVALMTAIILRISLEALQLFQRPHTQSEAESDVANKLFLAQFLDNAVVVLFAAFAEVTRNGFTRAAYISGCLQVIYTHLGFAILPHALRLFKFLVYNPLRRYWLLSRNEVFTQEQMNNLYQGEVFKLSRRCVFIGLAYGPGMPIAVVITAVQLWLFWMIDRWLIIKYHRKPTKYSLQPVISMWRFLPFGMLVHLFAGVFMLGNPSILNTATFSQPLTYGEFWRLSILDHKPFVESSEQLSVYAVGCAVLAVIALAAREWKAWGSSRLIRELVRWISARRSAVMEFFDESLKYPQYTSTFYRFLDERRQLTVDQWLGELRKGFVIHENGLVFRAWTTSGIEHGVRHLEGELLTTWESIGDASYSIFANQNYTYVMLTLANHMSRSLKRLEDDLSVIMHDNEDDLGELGMIERKQPDQVSPIDPPSAEMSQYHEEVTNALQAEPEDKHELSEAESADVADVAPPRHIALSRPQEEDKLVESARYSQGEDKSRLSTRSRALNLAVKLAENIDEPQSPSTPIEHVDSSEQASSRASGSHNEGLPRTVNVTYRSAAPPSAESGAFRAVRRSSIVDTVASNVSKRIPSVAELRRLSGGSTGHDETSQRRGSSRRESEERLPRPSSSPRGNRDELRLSHNAQILQSMSVESRTVSTHPDWEFVIEDEHPDQYGTDSESYRSYQYDTEGETSRRRRSSRRDSGGYVSDHSPYQRRSPSTVHRTGGS